MADLPDAHFRDLIYPYTGDVTKVEIPDRGFSSDFAAIISSDKGPFFVKAVFNRPGGRRDSIIRERLINPHVQPLSPNQPAFSVTYRTSNPRSALTPVTGLWPSSTSRCGRPSPALTRNSLCHHGRQFRGASSSRSDARRRTYSSAMFLPSEVFCMSHVVMWNSCTPRNVVNPVQSRRSRP